jgi:hypothetical protein
MINFSDMIEIEKYRPGVKIECMLLYFPVVKKYKIHYDYDTADGSFIFKIDDQNEVSDHASLWLELEQESEIPF